MLQRSAGGELLQPRQPLAEAFADDVLEVFVESVAPRDVEIREVVLLERQVDVAACGDLRCVWPIKQRIILAEYAMLYAHRFKFFPTYHLLIR